jgi:fatty-acyl-CoA synthase
MTSAEAELPGSNRAGIGDAAIGEILTRGASVRSQATAFALPEQRLSYAELLNGALRASRALAGLGVGRGERVGILMPNCVEFVELLFGCALMGAVAVPINARFKVYELSHVLDDGDIVALVTTDLVSEYVSYAALVEEAIATRQPRRLRRLVMLGKGVRPGFLNQGEFLTAADRGDVDDGSKGRGREVALMMFTSGTTSTPKGCPLTHDAMVGTATALAERYRLGDHERFWDPLPLFHMGAMIPMLAVLHSGGSFHTMTHFEPGPALSQVESERCTFMYPAVPTITQALVHHPNFKQTKLARVRAVLAQGLPQALRELQGSFPGAAVISSYGLTEASGISAAGGPDEDGDERSTCGRALHGMELRIMDPATGRQCEPGARGEIWLRGTGVFAGYYKRNESTPEIVDADGWLRTGDYGAADMAGRLTFLGRRKDMLKVGGENVAALEVEAYLLTHPSVKIAQVIGVPDAKFTEVPAAFVELVEGAQVGEDELIAFCQGQIASFKVPRYVRAVTTWPMSATKIQKARLRSELMAELGLVEP